jgi:hypothetical protein
MIQNREAKLISKQYERLFNDPMAKKQGKNRQNHPIVHTPQEIQELHS